MMEKDHRLDDYFVQYKDMVIRNIYLYVDYYTAEDLCQETFIRLQKYLERVKPEKVKAWLLAVSEHLALDYLKKGGKYDFEKSGMKIVYPKNPDDLVKEGHALHHCIGGYVERVADRKCIILFLRQCSDLQHPYYTIEIQGKRVIQVRGVGNCSATPEVDKFVKAWEQRVLNLIETAA